MQGTTTLNRAVFIVNVIEVYAENYGSVIIFINVPRINFPNISGE